MNKRWKLKISNECVIFEVIMFVSMICVIWSLKTKQKKNVQITLVLGAPVWSLACRDIKNPNETCKSVCVFMPRLEWITLQLFDLICWFQHREENKRQVLCTHTHTSVLRSFRVDRSVSFFFFYYYSLICLQFLHLLCTCIGERCVINNNNKKRERINFSSLNVHNFHYCVCARACICGTTVIVY